MQLNIKNIRKRMMQMPVVFHLALAILVLCILVLLVLKGLNFYTHHNQAIAVPDVKGLQIEEAAVFFENNGLRYTINDSVFTKEVKPGAIVEVIPIIGSKVKKGRILFITLNAKDAQKAAIPDVKDLSFRQAYALIQAQGFTSVETKYISGNYRDLVIGVELNGYDLKPGEQVPLSSTLILKVSDGGFGEDPDESDSIQSGQTETGRDTEG